MPTALAGSHGAKAYGASSGVVGDEFFWAVTMARSHGAAVPLPLRTSLHGSFWSIPRYLQNSKAYIILNKHTRKIEESLNVTFDETPPPLKTLPLVDDDLDEEEAIREIEKKNLENVVEDEILEIDEIINIKELVPSLENV
ncbi:hypothetical protein Tco_0212085 [Tanacetum coccineum]